MARRPRSCCRSALRKGAAAGSVYPSKLPGCRSADSMRVACRTGVRGAPSLQVLPKLPFAAPRYVPVLTLESKHDLTDVASDVLGQKLVERAYGKACQSSGDWPGAAQASDKPEGISSDLVVLSRLLPIPRATLGVRCCAYATAPARARPRRRQSITCEPGRLFRPHQRIQR